MNEVSTALVGGPVYIVQVSYTEDSAGRSDDRLDRVVCADVPGVAVRRPRAPVLPRWTGSQLRRSLAQLTRPAGRTRLPHLHGAVRLRRSADGRRRPLHSPRLPTRRHATSHPVTWYAGARRATASRPTCCQHCDRHRRHVRRLLAAVLDLPGMHTTREEYHIT